MSLHSRISIWFLSMTHFLHNESVFIEISLRNKPKHCCKLQHALLDLRGKPRKFQKYKIFTGGSWEHVDWHGTTHSGIGALKVPFKVKFTKILLVKLGLSKSQTWSKPPQNKNFHDFTTNPSLSESFVSFDKLWLESNTWEPTNI